MVRAIIQQTPTYEQKAKLGVHSDAKEGGELTRRLAHERMKIGAR